MDLVNGLCFNPLMHTAFDKEFMEIDEDMRLMYSSEIRDQYGSEAIDNFFRPYDREASPETRFFRRNVSLNIIAGTSSGKDECVKNLGEFE